MTKVCWPNFDLECENFNNESILQVWFSFLFLSNGVQIVQILSPFTYSLIGLM